MNLMELLQLVDARLRPLVAVDESALQSVLEEVAAGPRPEGVPPGVEPRVVLAGRLVEIETECRMLRERLHVQFTTAARLEIRVSASDQPHTRPAPEAPSEPD